MGGAQAAASNEVPRALLVCADVEDVGDRGCPPAALGLGVGSFAMERHSPMRFTRGGVTPFVLGVKALYQGVCVG